MQSVEIRPLKKRYRDVLYWLDDQLYGETTRSIVVHNSTIASAVGTTKRRVVEAIRALEEHGLVDSRIRYAEHGGYDANEYTVMPVNPRKQEQVNFIADKIKQSPFAVIKYLSRLAELHRTGVDIADMTLGELTTDLQYDDGSDKPNIMPFIDACQEAGLYPSDGFVW